MCVTPKCKNIDVNIRECSRSVASFSGIHVYFWYVPPDPPLPPPTLTPPPADIRTNTTTLTAISVKVTYGVSVRRPPYTALGVRIDSAPLRTHSGHWKPTDALFMHLGQIGRSQRTHRTYVSASGCR